MADDVMNRVPGGQLRGQCEHDGDLSVRAAMRRRAEATMS